ncbi:hypothetical protein ACOSQ3_021917 [Xanthoceras sorbifolium]
MAAILSLAINLHNQANAIFWHYSALGHFNVKGGDFLGDFHNANLKDVEHRGLCRGGCIGLLLNRGLILAHDFGLLPLEIEFDAKEVMKSINSRICPLSDVGPKPWPIVGSLPEMLRNKPTFRWIHDLMNNMNTEIVCIRLGCVHVIAVSCPKINRKFLKKQNALFASRPISMSTEMTSKGGEQWKKMKKIVTTEVVSPTRHRSKSRGGTTGSAPVEEADHLIRYVYNQCKNNYEDGGLVNVRVASRQYCGNVIRKMVFNKSFFGKGMEDGGPVLQYIYSFCVTDYIPFLRWKLDLDGHEKVMKKAIGIIEKYHDPLIEERVRQWRDGLKKDVEIMIATVDNPSNAVEWALAEMVNQPEILQKAIEEVDRVVGKERLVQESDFSQLNYIKACAREAFRLHPIAPFNVLHVSISDTIVANYFIPKGSHVLLSRHGLGRNSKAWPDEPLKFKPERHLKGDGSKVVLTENDLRFISFSTGRRGCPGGFTWTPPPDQPKIDLSEEEGCMFLAKPLVAVAKPRLAEHVYPTDDKT